MTLEISSMAIASTFVSTPLSLSRPILNPRQSRLSRFVLPGTYLRPQLEILNVSPFAHGFGASPFGFSGKIRGSNFQIPVKSADVLGSLSLTSENDADTVPVPIVVIDQDSDPNATIVQLSFGDRLGALIDTMKALKDLGLDVSKGTVTAGASDQTKFFITKMARKVDDPAMLERIRLTIIINLLKYHPESSEKLALGAAFGIKAPKKKPDVDMTTNIYIQDDGPKRSLLYVETPDRPGLLMEIIKMMADINLSVESAEIETEGLIVKDTFHVSYGGAALKDSVSQVLVNSLRYRLLRPHLEEESY